MPAAKLSYSGWSSSKDKPAIGSERWFEVALVRFIGGVNGTLNLFGFPVKFFGSPFQRPSEKDSVRCACFAHWLRIGTEK